jgi:SsrA-binding protein
MGARKGDRQVICENRRARWEFEISEEFEAGLILMGSEVKSLRNRNGHLSEAWVGFENGRPMLMKAHIAPYLQATHVCHEPDRPRPLLLHAREVAQLREAVRERGLTIVPLALILDGPWIKLLIAVGRGRKNYDKRHALREADDKREMARALARR